MFCAAELHNKNADVGSLPFALHSADTEVTEKIGG